MGSVLWAGTGPVTLAAWVQPDGVGADATVLALPAAAGEPGLSLGIQKGGALFASALIGQGLADIARALAMSSNCIRTVFCLRYALSSYDVALCNIRWALRLGAAPGNRATVRGTIAKRRRAKAPSPRTPGRAVQVDPIKPTLEAPGIKRLKLKLDILLSTFAFKFNLRRYNLAAHRGDVRRHNVGALRRRQGLRLVHFSAQPEPFLTQNTP